MNNQYIFQRLLVSTAVPKPVFGRVSSSSPPANVYLLLVNCDGEFMDKSDQYQTGNALNAIDHTLSSVSHLSTCQIIDDIASADTLFYLPDDDFSLLPRGRYSARLFESQLLAGTLVYNEYLYWDATSWHAWDGYLTGANVNISQEYVPPSRTALLESYNGQSLSNHLQPIELSPDDTNVLVAIDYINDPGSQRIGDVVSVSLVSGTTGGITWSINGVDHSKAKLNITAVTEGEYVLKVKVSYANTSIVRSGYLHLKVVGASL